MSDLSELYQELQLGIGDADEITSEIWDIIWKKAEDATKAKILTAVKGLDKYTMGINERPLKFALGEFYLIPEVLSAIREVTG